MIKCMIKNRKKNVKYRNLYNEIRLPARMSTTGSSEEEYLVELNFEDNIREEE